MSKDGLEDLQLSELHHSADLAKHAPSASVAVKIKTLPVYLNNRLDKLAQTQKKFEFNKDNEMVDRAIFLGLRQFDNQSIYIGQWYLRLRNGRGQQIYQDGSVYEGYWLDDKREGYGRFIDVSGEIYEGEWRDDNVNGRGRYTLKNGAYFVGQWVNNAQHGRGKEKWPTGEIYEGEYKKGLKDGKGVFKSPDGSYYEGEFSEGKIQGQGIAWFTKANIIGRMVDTILDGGKIMRGMAVENFFGLLGSDLLESIKRI